MSTDIIKLLGEVEVAETEVAFSLDMAPEDTANYRYAEICGHAINEIERLRQALITARICIVNYGDPKYAEKRLQALMAIGEAYPDHVHQQSAPEKS